MSWFSDRDSQRIIQRLDGITKRMDRLMATQQEVLDAVRQASTVSASTNIAVKEAIRLLKLGQADPAKNDEAIALLQALQADDAAVLTDNTTAEGETTEQT